MTTAPTTTTTAPTAARIDQDELVAEVTELLHDLVADGSLELATRYGPTALATPLAEDIAEETELDLEAWLLDREEVVELFIDAPTLRIRIRPIIKRLERGDGEPKWNEALAAAIVANPDDAHARMVFGDWLEQEGDPRGELVAVQAAIAEKEKGGSAGGAGGGEDHSTQLSKEDPLKRREALLLERFRTHLFGDLTREERATFHYGYFNTATVDGHQLERLFATHSSRFLRKLEVPFGVSRGSEVIAASTANSNNNNNNNNNNKNNPKCQLPITLEEISFGVVAQSEVGSSVQISAPLKALPELQSIDVAAENVTIDTFELPALRRLSINVRAVFKISSDAINISGSIPKLPALTELSIDVLRIDDEDTVTALRALIRNPPKDLTILRLHRLTIAAALVRELAESPLLAQLKVLDLRHSGINASHAPIFQENAGRFAHLERLDLRGLYLGNAEARFAKLCKEVAIGYERPSTAYDGENDDYEGGDYDEGEEGEEGSDDYWDEDGEGLTEDERVPEDDDVEEEVEEERQEPQGVDGDAPIEEQDRFDEPVE